MAMKIQVTAIVKVFNGYSFDTNPSSGQYDVLAKFSATGEKGFVQVVKGYNQDTPPDQIQQELQHVLKEHTVQVTGIMEISSYIKNGASCNSATIHATTIVPYNRNVDQNWINSLPGPIAQPKQKDINIEMEKTSAEEKAEIIVRTVYSL
jgi:hypothetical protein